MNFMQMVNELKENFGNRAYAPGYKNERVYLDVDGRLYWETCKSVFIVKESDMHNEWKVEKPFKKYSVPIYFTDDDVYSNENRMRTMTDYLFNQTEWHFKKTDEHTHKFMVTVEKCDD